MKINHKFSIVLLLFSACLTSHTYAQSDHDYLLRHVEEVSRDYFYIHLDESTSDLVLSGMVGGEHQTHYRLLGFLGDHFQVNIESISGVTYSTIDGEGLVFQENNDGTEIRVIWDSVWIDIAVSASSFTSDFVVTIKKIDYRSEDATVKVGNQ
ncbi:hypothetical protein [Vibrio sp. VB16]|uniref:hypothetical protein n=1 Tax=Vibrio sp. VB16 TaxID=2785746 RepID=UPI00189EBB8F|nr:hypothetical protein [Vibrio sp. VB16]UGA56597.1 hypothetical protein IUZ65_020575 [Vibrio sp. VB16]